MNSTQITMPNTITEQDFIDRFRPQANHLDNNASFDFGYGGCLYETYGNELAFVRQVEPARVWTVLDSDGELCLVSGAHYVNRLGYLICEVPVPLNYAVTVQGDELNDAANAEVQS